MGLLADLADKCRAAGRLMVGAAHAAQAARELEGQALGHFAAGTSPFFARKVHPHAGAAGAAAQTRVHSRTTVTVHGACATTCELTLPR